MSIKAKLSRRSLFPVILMDGTIGIEILEFFRLALLKSHDKDFLFRFTCFSTNKTIKREKMSE